MSLKGKTRTRQARYDVLKASARARQRAQARDRAAKAKPYDRTRYDGHRQEVSDGT